VRYGELALGLTAANFAQFSLLQPLYEASLRFFSVAAEAGQLSAFLSAVRRLTHAVARSLVIGSLLLVLATLVSGRRESVGLVVFSALFCILSGAAVAISGIQNAARQRAIVAWHDTISQWLRFGLAMALIAWLGPRSDMAMLGYVAAGAIGLTSQSWFLSRSRQIADASRTIPESNDVTTWERDLRQYAWPIATWGLFVGLYFISGRWALELVHSRSAVGLYAVVYQLGYYPVVMMSMLMMVVVQPIMFSRAGAGTDPVRIAQGHRLGLGLMGLTLSATVLFTLIALLCHSFVFSIAVGPDYRRVSYLLAPMILGSGVFSCAQVASLVGMINPDTTRLIRPKVGAAAIGIVLNFIGAWQFGIDGVVYASVLYGVIYLIWIVKVVGIVSWSEREVIIPPATVR
jgi:O-antigen/teichoic acid export membrane protein